MAILKNGTFEAGHEKRRLERKRSFVENLKNVKGVIPETLTKPEIDGIFADGVVPVELLADKITVLVPAWPRVRDNDNIRIIMDDQDTIFVGTETVFDSEEQEFPVPVSVSTRALTHGTHKIQYIIDAESGSQARSFGLEVVVDREAPMPSGAASLPDSYNDTITREDLNNSTLTPLDIPAYLRMEAGDVISVYWTGANGMGARLDDYEITSDDVSQQTITVQIPESVVTGGDEGSAKIYYYIRDRAGNTSIRAPDYNVSVILNPAPANLAAPYIPLAATPITDADTREPVKALIPSYQNILPGDFITLRWRGANVGSVTLPSPIPSEAYVTEITIPRSVIWASGTGSSEVDYVVTRGRVNMLSPIVSVEVDLDIPGPVDPDKDTSENEALLPLTVRGNVSQEDNKLLPQDLRQGAVALVPWYGNPKVGDIIRVYWGGRSANNVVDYAVTQEDLTNTPDNFVIDLPASLVDLTPEISVWPVPYDLINETNSNMGMTSYVDVHLVGAGGPDGLSPVIFLGKNDRGWLIEGQQVNPSTSVQIKAYDNMFIGDIVTLHWIGNSKTNGKGSDIAETEYTASVTVEQRHLREGVMFAVPHTPYILGIGYGSVGASYTVEQKGLLFESEPERIKVDMEGPAG